MAIVDIDREFEQLPNRPLNTEARTDPPSGAVRVPAPRADAGPEGEPRLDTLRAVTRHMATADHLDTVLQSIVTALVERANGLFSRLFLYLYDHECDICRARINAGQQVASDQRSLHLLATAGPSRNPNGPRHRMPLDGPRLASEVMRTGTPLHLPDVRLNERAMQDSVISELVRDRGAVGMAGYPLTYRGERLGVVGYVSRNTISVEAFEMLGIFADQAAMAIKNAFLFRELERYKERLQIENAYLAEEIRADRGFEDLVGASPALKSVIRQVKQVAPVDTTVLLTGETGTGKELVARAIHGLSPRSSRPLIKMNCGAIPQGLVESELFGHERGAFTGALQRRIGRFELADKGTLFMDEVGELPLDTQIKLLRVLQEHELERVGGTRANQRRRASGRGHQPRSRRRGDRRQVPLGSLLPAQRLSDSHPAAPGAARGRPTARQALPGVLPAQAREADPRTDPGQPPGAEAICLAGKHPRAPERRRTCLCAGADSHRRRGRCIANVRR